MGMTAFPEPSDFSMPFRFPNGLVLSAIELDCRGCEQRYVLKRGYGIASETPRGATLVGRAVCPHCARKARFVVALSPKGDARIQRVSAVTEWLMVTLLRRRPVIETTAPAPAPVTNTVRCSLSPDAIGRFMDRDIPAWIEVHGERYAFERVLPDGQIDPRRLFSDEYAIRPGIVFRRVESALSAVA